MKAHEEKDHLVTQTLDTNKYCDTVTKKMTSWAPASAPLLRRRGRKGLMEEKMESPEVEGGRERGRRRWGAENERR